MGQRGWWQRKKSGDQERTAFCFMILCFRWESVRNPIWGKEETEFMGRQEGLCGGGNLCKYPFSCLYFPSKMETKIIENDYRKGAACLKSTKE